MPLCYLSTYPINLLQPINISPPPLGDVENGGKDSPDAPNDTREEVDKKGAAGINPVVNAWLVQAWTSVRYVCPAALPYIGDRPPRIGLLGQGMVVYVLILHLYLLLFHARC